MVRNVARAAAAVAGALLAAAVARELGKPADQRTWHGSVAGIPYDFRPPTVEKVRRAFWNPGDPRLFTPHVFGMGWAVNLARLVEILRPPPPAEPARPSAPAEPVRPSAPAEPVRTTGPNEPAAPAASGKPPASEEPAAPPTPEGPVASGEPTAAPPAAESSAAQSTAPDAADGPASGGGEPDSA